MMLLESRRATRSGSISVSKSSDPETRSSAVVLFETDGALGNFFVESSGDAWRSDFEEPPLSEVKGIGATLLPFDF